MKKTLKLALLISVIVLIAWSAAAAQDSIINEDISKTAGNLEIPEGTTVNGNVSLTMGDLIVDGDINGDVSSNMGQILINGEVKGNVESDMGRVEVKGNVKGDVKGRMGEIIIDGLTGGNVETSLGRVIIGGTVGGDVDSGLGKLNIEGTVLGNVTSSGKVININGTVEGDVNVPEGLVELGPEAVVTGRVYVERGMVKTSPGAETGSIEVEKERTEREIEDLFSDGSFRFRDLEDAFNIDISIDMDSITSTFREFRAPEIPVPAFWTGMGKTLFKLINMIVLFALSVLTFSLFPKNVNNVVEAIKNKTGNVILYGVLAALLSLPVIIFLFITILGIPLIFVQILLLGLAWILGYTGLSLWVGDRIITTASSTSQEANPLKKIGLGVLILGVIGFIPILGGLLSIAVFIMSLGSALASRFGSGENNTPGSY